MIKAIHEYLVNGVMVVILGVFCIWYLGSCANDTKRAPAPVTGSGTQYAP